MLKKIYSFILLLFMTLSFFPFYNTKIVKADTPTFETEVHQSVDDDLATFDFDYEKYFIDKELCYRPIIISFNESLSEEYADLLYLYDPNNLLEESISVTFQIFLSNNSSSISGVQPSQVSKEAIYDSSSSDGNVKRYSLITEKIDKSNYALRRYKIIKINDYETSCIYDFDNNGNTTYSNSLNIRLGDPHNWSYHFDEDNGWQNLVDWISRSDDLKDQLFYSFYIPDGFDVSNIQSIDMQYKKVLLHGYRHNRFDEGTTHEFYVNPEDDKWTSKFYKWHDSNTLDDYNTDDFLGYSTIDFGSKVPYTYKTITSSSVVSEGKKHSYKWDNISSVSDFREAFKKDGEDGPVYNFAKQYFTEEGKNYFIINYDSFYYTYNWKICSEFSMIPAIAAFWFHPNNKSFRTYLEERDVPYWYGHPEALITGAILGYFVTGPECYEFYEEYTFDVSATSICYVDSDGFNRSAAVSVAPVMLKEGSGGGSEGVFADEMPEWLKTFLIVLGVIAGILLLVLVAFGIEKLVAVSNGFSEGINLSIERRKLRHELNDLKMDDMKEQHDRGKKN